MEASPEVERRNVCVNIWADLVEDPTSYVQGQSIFTDEYIQAFYHTEENSGVMAVLVFIDD